MTDPNLTALACEDCPATIHTSRGTGMFGPVLVVVVTHELTCPWMARVAPEGATLSGPAGILMHVFRDTSADPDGAVGDEA